VAETISIGRSDRLTDDGQTGSARRAEASDITAGCWIRPGGETGASNVEILIGTGKGGIAEHEASNPLTTKKSTMRKKAKENDRR
jgi:hypothetical protein